MFRLFPFRTRNWLSFNLRALLVGVTLAAIACAAVVRYYLPFQQQRAAIAALNGKYGYVTHRLAGPTWMRRWFGDEHFQDVVVLHLEDREITNDDLQHIAQLRKLENLYLANNPGITDQGLVHLRNLPHLHRMSLHGTRVKGAGLEHLATCPNLTEIDASTLLLTPEMLTNLKQMPQLTWFATPGDVSEETLLQVAEFPNNACLDFRYGLYCKDLTDAAVSALGKIHGAKTVTLEQCRFSAAAWKDFCPPTKCSNLSLVETPIPAEVAASFLEKPGTEKFQTLHIDYSSLRIRALIEQLPEKPLASASIQQNAIKLTQTATLHLYRYSPPEEARLLCENLRVYSLTIDIHEIGESIGKVKGVQELQVNCVATPELFAGIAELTELRQLNLNGLAVEDFSPLGNLHELEVLALPPHNLPAENFRFLANLTKMRQLTLSGNRLDEQTLKSIGAMTQLHSLSIDFAGAGLNDKAFAAVRGCKNLRFLSCAGAPITYDSLPILRGLPKLKIANLTGTKISEEGQASLKTLLQQLTEDPASDEDFDSELPQVVH